MSPTSSFDSWKCHTAAQQFHADTGWTIEGVSHPKQSLPRWCCTPLLFNRVIDAVMRKALERGVEFSVTRTNMWLIWCLPTTVWSSPILTPNLLTFYLASTVLRAVWPQNHCRQDKSFMNAWVVGQCPPQWTLDQTGSEIQAHRIHGAGEESGTFNWCPCQKRTSNCSICFVQVVPMETGQNTPFLNVDPSRQAAMVWFPANAQLRFEDACVARAYTQTSQSLSILPKLGKCTNSMLLKYTRDVGCSFSILKLNCWISTILTWIAHSAKSLIL